MIARLRELEAELRRAAFEKTVRLGRRYRIAIWTVAECGFRSEKPAKLLVSEIAGIATKDRSMIRTRRKSHSLILESKTNLQIRETNLKPTTEQLWLSGRLEMAALHFQLDGIALFAAQRKNSYPEKSVAAQLPALLMSDTGNCQDE